MIDEQTEELASLYVLGALPGTEAAEFENTARRHPEVAALVHDLSQISAALTGTFLPPVAPGPPPELKGRILARLDEPRVAASATSIGQGQFSFAMQAMKGDWKTLPVPGCRLKELEVNDRYAMILLQLDPGTTYPHHHHSGPEECYVLEGDIRIAGQTLRAGDFHHAAASSTHGVSTTEKGCTLLLVVAAQDYLGH